MGRSAELSIWNGGKDEGILLIKEVRFIKGICLKLRKSNIIFMKAETVIELVELLESNKIDVVVDGGWGVDALLCKQTRPHDDLDIAVSHEDVPKLREILAENGFKEIFSDDSRDCPDFARVNRLPRVPFPF